MENIKIKYAFVRLLKRGKIRKCLLAGSECSGNSIDSHSIQNSVIIEKLSENGHVYVLRANDSGSGLKLKLEGRNIASTFEGFCSFHDAEIFREIDFKNDGIPGIFTPRQNALFFLRAIAIEGWKKQSIVNSFEKLSPAIQNNDYSKIAEVLKLPEESIKSSLRNPEVLLWSLEGHMIGVEDSNKLLGSLKWQLANNKFHNTISHHWIIDSFSNVAVTSGFSPLWDLNGKNLYRDDDAIDGRMAHLGVNIFGDGNKTHILISYPKKDKQFLEVYIQQIHDLFFHQQKIKSWLTSFILENCENFVLSPNFIKRLSDQQIAELEQASSWSMLEGGPPKNSFTFCFFD